MSYSQQEMFCNFDTGLLNKHNWLLARIGGGFDMAVSGGGEQNEANKSEVMFAQSVNAVIHHDQLKPIASSELLIPTDYEYVITDDMLQRMCESTPFPDMPPYIKWSDEQKANHSRNKGISYKNKLRWSEDQISAWKAAGKPHQWLVTGGPDRTEEGEFYLIRHANRIEAVENGTISASEPPMSINPLTGLAYETDDENHPLNSHWEKLLELGIGTGPGFYYREGTGGNVEGMPTASDPFVFRIQKREDGEYLQIFVSKRSDMEESAFLGGMLDPQDVDRKGFTGRLVNSLKNAAKREFGEEGNVGAVLNNSPYLPCGFFEVLDVRTTLNTQVTTGVTAFFVNEEFDYSPDVFESLGLAWVDLNEARLRPEGMFASHEELAKVAIAKIQRVCGFVIDKNGKIGKFEEKERESLVDPAEWYEELKRAGHPEVELVKTAPVKIRICQQDGEELNTAQDQTQSINNIGDIFITNVDEEGHPLEHEYPFGDKEKKTPQERVKEFYDTYYEDHNKPGFYRKKGIIRGIQVSETRRMSAKWSPNGAELKAGGYLIMKADNDYYPINPDSLTSYRVVTDLREEE